MANFSSVLQLLRKSRGLTQHELAKQAGISRSRLSMYELGQREPDIDVLELLADFFNVDVDYLLGRTNKTTVLPQSMMSKEEQDLLGLFRTLNTDGRSLAMEQVRLTASQKKYTHKKNKNAVEIG